jgi:FAD/FMN-containing dehydrogenase
MDALNKIRAIVGPQGVVTDPAQMPAYLVDRREYYQGRVAMIVRPRSTAEVARIVQICQQSRIGIVPQGGNTGLCGGATPDASGTQMLLCLSRMNAIREVDPIDFTMTVEAGAILQNVQEAAAAHDLYFPLDLAAKGSCQIGGNLSTNAGGNNVLRYGNARELVLGLEVVLPDGRVWDGLRKLRKDNTGYDLKQLFLGAEGTLGVITAAVLRLFPKPQGVQTAFIAVPDPAAAGRLLRRARAVSGDAVSSFEYLSRLAVELVQEHSPGTRDPLAQTYRHYVLAELSSAGREDHLRSMLENAMEAGLQAGEVLDGVIATSAGQRAELWRIRETVPDAQRSSVKNDVSVPISQVPAFLRAADELVQRVAPGARPCPFGHIGDGNIHYNILRPPGADAVHFRKTAGGRLIEEISRLVMQMGGSFSAEHGIGQLRRDFLLTHKQSSAIDLMRAIKAAVDPAGIMNPGKVI